MMILRRETNGLNFLKIQSSSQSITSVWMLRQLAYDRLKKVADSKLFSIFDFDKDPKNLLTAHEMLGYIDGSLATKFTV